MRLNSDGRVERTKTWRYLAAAQSRKPAASSHERRTPAQTTKFPWRQSASTGQCISHVQALLVRPGRVRYHHVRHQVIGVDQSVAVFLLPEQIRSVPTPPPPTCTPTPCQTARRCQSTLHSVLPADLPLSTDDPDVFRGMPAVL